MRIIDSHIHLGNNRETKFFDLAELERDLDEAGADGAVVMAFPEDIYRIADSPESRERANAYVRDAKLPGKTLYPAFFIWNDFFLPDDLERYCAIKWHRHSNEPTYDYDDPRCKNACREIARLGLPVILEEEFSNTDRFIEGNPDINVIIPHMGMLNGGCKQMDRFFDNPRVFFDTSVAAAEDIRRVLDAVGPERVLFGSDVSGTPEPFFNFTRVEREKIESMNLSEEELSLIFAGMFSRTDHKKKHDGQVKK